MNRSDGELPGLGASRATLVHVGCVALAGLLLPLTRMGYTGGLLLFALGLGAILSVFLVPRLLRGPAPGAPSRHLAFLLLLFSVANLLAFREEDASSPRLVIVYRLLAVLPVLGALLLVSISFARRAPTRLRATAIAGIGLSAAASLTLFVLLPPPPVIDVIHFQEEGAEALIEGRNPYEIRYTNLYGTETDFYPDGEAEYQPYPPATFLFAVVGSPLGDIRRLHLLVHLATAALVFFTARRLALSRHVAALLALLFLWLPGIHFQLREAWTDTLVLFALVLASALAASGRRCTSALSVGLFLALKQTTLLSVPFLLLRFPRPSRKTLLLAAAVPMLTYGAFLLWNARALIEDVVWFHFESPYRPDGITISAFLARRTGAPLPGWFAGLAFAGGMAAWAFRLRCGREEGSRRTQFALLGFAHVYLLVLLASKHAFFNYFSFFLCVLLLGVVFGVAADRRGASESRMGEGESS